MSNWIPISERLPTREDADERGEVVWKWADGGTCTGRFEDGAEQWICKRCGARNSQTGKPPPDTPCEKTRDPQFEAFMAALGPSPWELK